MTTDLSKDSDARASVASGWECNLREAASRPTGGRGPKIDRDLVAFSSHETALELVDPRLLHSCRLVLG